MGYDPREFWEDGVPDIGIKKEAPKLEEGKQSEVDTSVSKFQAAHYFVQPGPGYPGI